MARRSPTNGRRGRKGGTRQRPPTSERSHARLGFGGPTTNQQPAAKISDDAESLSVTHWFDSGKGGDPYTAKVRFAGRRRGISRKSTARDTFVTEETIEGVVPGSGPVSISTLVDDLTPGEWDVTADLVGIPPRAGGPQPFAANPTRPATLPRATWSWRRWALSDGALTPVQTHWWPWARFTRRPAVIHGSWTGLIAIGVVAGVLLQTTLLGRENVSVASAVAVDVPALLTGLLGAKVWQLARQPRSHRRASQAGWSVDGLLVGAPAAGVAVMLALNLPIGEFLDASAPGLFFGVAIGRLGCFFTGCCAGRCTRSRWGIWSSDRRVGARRIPTQLLESAAGLLIGLATLALVLAPLASFPGAVFIAALAAYVLVRQGLLALRSEPHTFSIRPQLTAAAASLLLLADIGALAVGIA